MIQSCRPRALMVLGPLFLGGLWACEVPPVTAVPTARHQVELRGVTLDRFVQDRLADRTFIEQAELDRVLGVVNGRQIRSEIYDSEPGGAVKGYLQADRATSELHSRQVTLEGKVRLSDLSDRVIRTEVLHYDGATGLLTGDQQVVLEGENFRAEGMGLRGDLAAGTFELGPPVRAVVQPKN